MIIYIPTYGRVHKQVTLSNLPSELRKTAVLVVYQEEADMFGDQPVLICPKTVRGIAAKRQFIIDHHNKTQDDPRLVMLDDDLRFFTRRTDDPTKFQPATDDDLSELFRHINDLLCTYAHVGVMGREGANRATAPKVHVTRMMRVLAYNAQTCKKQAINFVRGGNMCDFDVTLQLLTKGYPNCVIANFVQDQGSSNAPGGCSITRSMDEQRKDAIHLHERFPKFVKLVEKTTKTAWGGQTRTDVQVQWKAAYGSYDASR